jgi:hypothetical protein
MTREQALVKAETYEGTRMLQLRVLVAETAGGTALKKGNACDSRAMCAYNTVRWWVIQ